MNGDIIKQGSIPFSQFQRTALYHPQAGFYASAGGAGRQRDFLTSPEVGNLFAVVLARALDAWWQQWGRPNPFYVIEVGAGTGTLAADIVGAVHTCANALRYVTVEQSFALRSEQNQKLPIHSADEVLDPLSRITKGPVATALATMPTGRFNGVILANELLDNMPVDVFERRGYEWREVRVGLGRQGDFMEVLAEVQEGDLEFLERHRKDTPDGGRIPRQAEAQQWLATAIDTIDRGRIVTFDYVRTTRWMARHSWDEWMRTYRNHRPGGSPYDSPGTQDITCEVAVDQLSLIRRPSKDRTQTEFLETYGLFDLVADARDKWHAQASLGDLNAARARSRVQEGRALTDEEGLGRYRVLEWDITNR